MFRFAQHDNYGSYRITTQSLKGEEKYRIAWLRTFERVNAVKSRTRFRSWRPLRQKEPIRCAPTVSIEPGPDDRCSGKLNSFGAGGRPNVAESFSIVTRPRRMSTPGRLVGFHGETLDSVPSQSLGTVERAIGAFDERPCLYGFSSRRGTHPAAYRYI